jgi:hypothetical protein
MAHGVGRDGDTSAVLGDSGVEIAPASKGGAEVDVSLGEVGLDGEGAAVLGDGGVEIALEK